MNPVDALLRYPLFALLGRRLLQACVASGQELAVAAGKVLLQAGTPGAWAYLLLQGRARVPRCGAARREVPLAVYGPGRLVGEYALLPPHSHTATCRASEPARALRLPLLP